MDNLFTFYFNKIIKNLIYILRCHCEQLFRATEAEKKICEVEKKEVVSFCRAQKWFKEFNERHTDISDELHLDCPIVVNTEAICKASEANPSIGTSRLLI